MRTVGEILRAKREEMGLTLAGVAEQAGLTKSYLSMIENHRVANPPSKGAIEALERALKLKEGELVTAANWENTPSDLRERLVRAEETAKKVQEIAKWMKQSGGKRKEGGKSIDELFTSGELSKRINAALKGNETPPPEPNVNIRVPIGVKVPLINKVQAGYPKDFTDMGYPAKIADEYVAAAEIHDHQAFAARVVGDSMEPNYNEGDIIVFSPNAKVEDGDDCFVRVEPDHETTFKRIYFEKSKTGKQMIRLQPLNPAFASATYEREQVAGLYKAVLKIQKL